MINLSKIHPIFCFMGPNEQTKVLEIVKIRSFNQQFFHNLDFDDTQNDRIAAEYVYFLSPFEPDLMH